MFTEEQVLAALLKVVLAGFEGLDVPYAAGAQNVAVELGLSDKLKDAYMAKFETKQ